MMDPFFRLYVSVTLQNEKILHWTMNPTYRPTASSVFFIDKARSAGVWENVAGPIADNCFYVDTSEWNWNKDRNTFYRVRLQNGADWIYGTPVQAMGGRNRQDYALARELWRKELTVARLGGQAGVFLKRRHWGTPCSNCTDFDTREVVNISCPICMGTGIVGGYYAPIPMFVWNATPPTNTRDIEGGLGVSQQTRNENRCVAYPFIEKLDVWMSSNDNTRWVINDVKLIAERKGVPVIYDLTMSMAPFSDVLYSAPMTAIAVSEPSVEPTGTEHTWSKGLSCQEKF